MVIDSAIFLQTGRFRSPTSPSTSSSSRSVCVIGEIKSLTNLKFLTTMGLGSFLLNGFPLSEMSPVSHMFLSPAILVDLLKNALSTDGSFRNRPFHN